MTTNNSKTGVSVRTRFFLFLGFALLSNLCSAQLDSVSVSLSMTHDVQDGDTLNTIHANLYVSDINFMQEVTVIAYDDESNTPLGMIQKTKAELDAEGSISGSTFSLDLDELENIEGTYRLDVQVLNLQGGHYPLVSENY